jgi:hypothetical protein
VKFFENKKNKVLMIIMMAVKDEIVPFITNVEESSLSWMALQKLFEN